jgi:hypothetical protein
MLRVLNFRDLILILYVHIAIQALVEFFQGGISDPAGDLSF